MHSALPSCAQCLTATSYDDAVWCPLSLRMPLCKPSVHWPQTASDTCGQSLHAGVALVSLIVLSLLLVAARQRADRRHAYGWASASGPPTDVDDELGHLRLAHRGRHFIVVSASSDSEEEARR